VARHLLYKKGKIVRRIKDSEVKEILIKEINEIADRDN
jgi:hypothetical protein